MALPPSPNPGPAARAILADLNGGQFKRAFQGAKKALAKAPGDAGLASLAGMALAQQGRLREAVPYFQKAVKLAPQEGGHQTNLLQALVMLKANEPAIRLAERMLAKAPENDGVLYLLAMAQKQSGATEAARATVRRALEANPGNANAHNLDGVMHLDTDDLEAALTAFDTALAIAPSLQEGLSNKAIALSSLGRHDEAKEVLERSLAIGGDHAPSLRQYAVELSELGDFEEAAALLERLAADNPDDLDVLSALSAHRRDETADFARKLDRLLRRTAPGSRSYAQGAFARAECARRLGAAEEAREWYARANATRAALSPFDQGAEEARLTRALRDFPAGEALEEKEAAPPRMIFVIGLPRSGTTLTAQVISNHSAAISLGEHPATERLMQAAVDTFDAGAFAAGYLESLPEAASRPGLRAIVDKVPMNYYYLGYLARAFPSARFIHLARDPRDTALSIWRQSFRNPAMDWSFDLNAMAEQANRYRRYMRHWEGVLGARLMTLAYEDLVRDIEGATRRIASHCGLDWEETMCAPETNPTRVRTASIFQVRKPVNTGSIGGWQAEAEALAPFIAGLDPALWPELAPS